MESDLEDGVDALAGIRLGAERLDPLDRQCQEPVTDQVSGVGRPAVEVVIEGAGCHAEPIAYFGQFEAAITECGEYFETGLEVRVSGHNRRHIVPP